MQMTPMSTSDAEEVEVQEWMLETGDMVRLELPKSRTAEEHQVHPSIGIWRTATGTRRHKKDKAREVETEECALAIFAV